MRSSTPRLSPRVSSRLSLRWKLAPESKATDWGCALQFPPGCSKPALLEAEELEGTPRRGRGCWVEELPKIGFEGARRRIFSLKKEGGRGMLR
jgi:hypothetical protein